MYDNIRTFTVLAETGSFTKAAEKLYMTHTAVIKQINLLEAQLNVKLINRTNRGVSLTVSGQSFYNDCIDILSAFDQAVDRARRMGDELSVIRVGCSGLYPSQKYMVLWEALRSRCPDIHLEFVEFEDDIGSTARLGKDYDCLIGSLDPNALPDKCRFLQLGFSRLMFAVSRKHPLAKRDVLSIRDLNGERLNLISSRLNSIYDNIRSEITEKYPNIEIIDCSPNIDLHTFNKCAKGDYIMLIPEIWDQLHPSIRLIPIKENYLYPFGIIYSTSPQKNLEEFLQLADSIMNAGKS